MKKFTLIILCICISNLYAQIPDGGIAIINPDINTYGFYGEDFGSLNTITVSDQSFSEAIAIDINDMPEFPWSIALTFDPLNSIATSDVMLMSFYARTTSSADASGNGIIRAVVQENTIYTPVLNTEVSISDEWQEYYLPFESNQTLNTSQISVTLQLGYPNQTLEIANVQLINYEDTLTLDDLPTNNDDDDDSDWPDDENEWPAESDPNIPTGGEDLISSNIADYGFYGDAFGTTNVVTISDQEFTEASEIDMTSQPDQPWSIAHFFAPNDGIDQNDVLLMTFYARTTSSSDETGSGFLRATLQNNTTYQSALLSDQNISTEWKKYYLPFRSNQTLNTSQIFVGIQTGFTQQTLEIAGVRLLNFENRRNLEDLPFTEITYVGQEGDAAWRAEAQQRIEEIRKGTLDISVVNEMNRPVYGAKVTVQMKSHLFGFGTAVAVNTYLNNSTYRDQINALFNTVVLENGLKWETWFDDANKERTTEVVNAFNELGIPVRGHVLVWPSFRYNPDFVSDYADDPEGLRALINTHVSDITSTYSGQLLDWDVINEPYENHEFMDILGYSEMASWFQLAREGDPDAKLYINDYDIIAGGGLNINHQNAYYDTILQIDEESEQPAEGIGMQGHFSSLLTAPTKLYSILDRYAELDKEIKITEFDIDVTQREVQAAYTKDFMTLVFSHPSVSSFLMWGFWEGQHWKPDAAMFDIDWTPRPNYEAYTSLVFDEWWTPNQTFATRTRPTRIDGFLGTYEIVIEYRGKTSTHTVLMDKATEDNIVELQIDTSLPITRNCEHQTKAYPTLVNEELKVQLCNYDGYYTTLQILDFSGNLVKSKPISKGEHFSLNTNDLKKGFYFLEIKQGENTIDKIRFIK